MAETSNVLVLVIVLSLCHLANCRQCYTCSGPLNEKCGKLQNISPSNCPDYNVCARYILQNPGQDILHRTCSPLDICTILEKQYENAPDVTVKDCSVCEEDGCNSAPIAKMSLGLVFAVLLRLVL